MPSSADRNDRILQRPIERLTDQTASLLPRITVFTRSYPPAYLAGGPARSVHALVESLAAQFKFSVVTSAFDEAATEPMQSIELSRWSTFGEATIWYEDLLRMPARTVVKLLKDAEPEILYLNSLFDYRFAILPLLISRMRFSHLPVILAPRGELSAGALSLKPRKKRAFVAAFRLLKLHRTITWHASTHQDKAEIESVFGSNLKIITALNLRTGLLGGETGQGWSEESHRASAGNSLVFFSRIVPKKNLASAIQAMQLLKGNAHLSIAGPIEDPRYWGQCLELINRLPDSERVEYLGTIPADDVVSFLSRFDLFVFPTLGENFGHVVLESLAAGTPIIVGSDTPWRKIEASGAGWVCDPTDPGALAKLIENFLSLDEEARGRMRLAARNLATEVLNDPGSLNANRAMFRSLTANAASS
jgi:glycosyltransferase involved in cell wall biosynthesis